MLCCFISDGWMTRVDSIPRVPVIRWTLERATRAANARNIAIYSFYAPSVGLTSRSHLAASYGQSSLNRISNETGGKAFFQGITGFVSFDPYFSQLRQALNQRF